MPWEPITKGQLTRNRYGDHWKSTPAVAVNKTGLTFNEPFKKAYLNGENEVMVFLDRANLRLGVRAATSRDEGAHQLKPTSVHSECMVLKTPVLGEAFPAQAGKAYRARLNADTRVIEVDLRATNVLATA